MKKISILFVVVLFPLISNGQFTKKLIAHWSFNGNTMDASGNALHGTGTAISYGLGKSSTANSAVVLNGTSSFINVPYKAAMNTDTITICTIIKLNDYYTGTCEGNYVIARGDVSTAGGYGLQAYDNPYNSCGVLDTSKEVFGLMARSLTNATAQQYSPNIISKNWYCVIGTFDGTTSKMYINGILKSTDVLSSPTTMGTSTSGITIGAYGAGSGTGYPYWVNGAIDDMRLYGRTLSTTEIDSYCNHYNNLNGETNVAVSPENQQSLNIFPNPTSGSFTISGLVSTNNPIKICVHNSIGQVMLEDAATPTNNSVLKQVDLQHVPTGVYYVQLRLGDATQIHKLIVQH